VLRQQQWQRTRILACWSSEAVHILFSIYGSSRISTICACIEPHCYDPFFIKRVGFHCTFFFAFLAHPGFQLSAHALSHAAITPFSIKRVGFHCTFFFAFLAHPGFQLCMHALSHAAITLFSIKRVGFHCTFFFAFLAHPGFQPCMYALSHAATTPFP